MRAFATQTCVHLDILRNIFYNLCFCSFFMSEGGGRQASGESFYRLIRDVTMLDSQILLCPFNFSDSSHGPKRRSLRSLIALSLHCMQCTHANARAFQLEAAVGLRFDL